MSIEELAEYWLSRMSELESARYWLSWIELGRTIALLLVAIGVAWEFLGDRLERPLRAKIEAAHEAEIAQLRNDNLAMEKMLRPRRVPFVIKDRERFARFSGTRVLIQSVPDFEAIKLARDISWALGRFGWKPEIVNEQSTHIESLAINDGVQIFAGNPPIVPDIPLPDDAATLLGEYLTSCEVPNVRFAARDKEKQDEILLLIGVKPLHAEIEIRRWERGFPAVFFPPEKAS
jgi:hypothetical protein